MSSLGGLKDVLLAMDQEERRARALKRGPAPKVEKRKDVFGDGTLWKEAVVELNEMRAEGKQTRPEWGDRIWIRTAQKGADLLDASQDPKVRRKNREEKIKKGVMSEKILIFGEEDLYSKAASTLVRGETADFYTEDDQFGCTLLKWEPRRMPEGAVERIEVPLDLTGGPGRTAWKYVWRQGKVPWVIANPLCDITYRRTCQRIIPRPPSHLDQIRIKTKDFEGDDIDEDYDDYVDAFPEMDDDEIFLPPDDWTLDLETTVSAAQVENDDSSKSSLDTIFRKCLEHMAQGERATLYFRGTWDDGTFATVVCWDVELVEWIENEVVSQDVVKRTTRKPPHGEWARPGPLDHVKVKIDDRLVEWGLDSGLADVPSSVEAALMKMRRGEVAEVRCCSSQEDFVIVEDKKRKPALTLPRDEKKYVSWVVELVDFTAVKRSEDRVAELKKLGNTAFERGDLDRALRRYDEALGMAMGISRLDALRAVLHTNKAACHIKQEAYRKALTSCEAALAIEPQRLAALRRKAKAHVLLGELTEAVRPMKACLDLAPNDPQTKREAADLQRRIKARKAKTQAAFAKEFKEHERPEPKPAITEAQLRARLEEENVDDGLSVPTAADLARRRDRSGKKKNHVPEDLSSFEDFEDAL